MTSIASSNSTLWTVILLLITLPACSKSNTDSESPDAKALQKADALLAKLTLDDKIALVTGATRADGDIIKSVGHIIPIIHGDVNIPALYLADGPNGVGNGITGVTQFPPVVSLGASWDVDLAKSYGVAIGTEWRGKGINIGLAPGMNITPELCTELIISRLII